jgi:hypothetical protein
VDCMNSIAPFPPNMTEDYHSFIQRAFAQYPEARAFVNAFCNYCHSIDDIVDGDETDKIAIIRTFELAAVIFASPFYVANINSLQPIVIMITNMYMDSVVLENDYKEDKEEWKLQTAKVLSHSFNELIVACADLCGGFNLRRDVSVVLRAFSHNYQEK